MSAPRRLTAWLWAAIWLRWRLARVRLRRRFGGVKADPAGASYYLDASRIPVEGVDYDRAELPAALVARLEDARLELLERSRELATPGVSGVRRGRRVASIATAALLGLAGVGGGAAALVTGSTGVPAVDRLLGIAEVRVDQPGVSGRPGGTAGDFQPRSSGSSVSVEAPVGSRRLVASSYLARDGRICSVLTDDDGAGVVGDLACVAPDVVATRLATEAGMAAIANQRDAVVIWGLVDGGVTRLTGRGPRGPLEVRLGETASLDGVSGVESVKAFIATGESYVGAVDPTGYVLHAVNDDGESTKFAP